MNLTSDSLRPHGLETIARLLAKGVTMPLPQTVYVGEEVDPDRISGEGVVLHPGTRVRGAATVISAHCELGAETPMTVENCQLGRGVALRGGFAQDAVFLEGSSLGSGAHVRGGTILEEQANGAHTVGLKQTILFPFVTLGSLINFCDVLLAGGTSRSDHSEVGSSYIHFNFTPDGDKTTASLFGDVPRGVLLDQPPIFLGGQGGAVGPVTTGFGAVVGAGSVLRDDIGEDGQLVLPASPAGVSRPVIPARYRKLPELLGKNVTYLANLSALAAWYRQARRPFFARLEHGDLLLGGALAALESARTERVRRIGRLVGRVDASDEGRAQLQARRDEFMASLGEVDRRGPEEVLSHLRNQAEEGVGYLDAVAGLGQDHRRAVREWLAAVVSDQQEAAAATVPQLGLVWPRRDAPTEPTYGTRPLRRTRGAPAPTQLPR